MNLLLNKAHFPVTVLGPGRRIGLWLQGCTISGGEPFDQPKALAALLTQLDAWRTTAGLHKPSSFKLLPMLLLALVAAARAAGVPPDSPLLRTLRRSEPIVLRVQDRLDAWAHAARINALFRNRNLAQGAGGLFGVLFMFAAQVLSRFLIWLLIIPAALFGWRMWGILELRNAIRALGRTLPARVPSL